VFECLSCGCIIRGFKVSDKGRRLEAGARSEAAHANSSAPTLMSRDFILSDLPLSRPPCVGGSLAVILVLRSATRWLLL
jgi:hypothetical protein